MKQSIPLTSVVDMLLDRFKHNFDIRASDGVLCSDDIAALRPDLAEIKQESQRSDLARAWGMAVMKRGLDGKRAKELEGELQRFEETTRHQVA